MQREMRWRERDIIDVERDEIEREMQSDVVIQMILFNFYCYYFGYHLGFLCIGDVKCVFSKPINPLNLEKEYMQRWSEREKWKERQNGRRECGDGEMEKRDAEGGDSGRW